MITKLLNAFMDYALSRPVNQGKSYEGEDSPGWAYTIKDEKGDPYLSRVLLPRMRLPLIGSFRQAPAGEAGPGERAAEGYQGLG
jgi:hypothetical protein